MDNEEFPKNYGFIERQNAVLTNEQYEQITLGLGQKKLDSIFGSGR